MLNEGGGLIESWERGFLINRNLTWSRAGVTYTYEKQNSEDIINNVKIILISQN